MCVVKFRGTAVGWEMQCGVQAHFEDSAARCTRTLRWSANGGEEDTLRRLRWWAAQGLLGEVDDRDEHTRLPKHGPDNDPENLPTLEELDGLVADGDGEVT